MGPERIVTVTLNTAIDRVVIDGREIARHPGGKGINVSRVLGILGTSSVATGFVGEGEVATYREGLPGPVEAHLIPVPGRTRINTTTLDLENHTEVHARTEGFRVHPAHVRALTAAVTSHLRAGTVVVFAGSLPSGMDPVDLRTMVRACRDRDARIVVDTSGDALDSVRAEPMWLLKLNAEELAELTGAPAGTREQILAAVRTLGGAIENVCITRGSEGAILITPSETLFARADVDRGRVVSTVGCGDALLAGLLHARHTGRSWECALRGGVAAATARATAWSPGIMDPVEIARFTDSIGVEQG